MIWGDKISIFFVSMMGSKIKKFGLFQKLSKQLSPWYQEKKIFYRVHEPQIYFEIFLCTSNYYLNTLKSKT